MIAAHPLGNLEGLDAAIAKPDKGEGFFLKEGQHLRHDAVDHVLHPHPEALFQARAAAWHLQDAQLYVIRDAHFRNVVTIAGHANAAVQELWDGPIKRSLKQVDGWRRAQDMSS
ncbi:hypothetical protein MesoLj131a_60980 [Mesorhizobium sp. 131-2-1]|nr:hypothetical protein MesoLj131a_60980 [Mesorhizobium sp. 131-2-1]BCH04304.1 hypothetical protein MesoLj131b_63030 [Mesorhizobium sp. 131-2-5]